MSDLSEYLSALSPKTLALLSKRIEDKSHKAFKKQIITRRSQLNDLPLSFAQQRLWYLSQLESNSSAYNISDAIRLQGTLNLKVLKRTIEEIIRRHEILRTTFALAQGQPVQVIHSVVNLTMPVVDLQALSTIAQHKEVQNLAEQEAQQPFNLEQELLLRVTVLQLSSWEHIVLFTMHHIVSDGWSMGILIQEVATLYEAFSNGKPSPLPELNIQYADFAVWQRHWLQGKVLETQLSYWRQKLGGKLPVLKLPYRQQLTTLKNNYSLTHNFELSQARSRSLQQLGRQTNATLFMILLAALKTLLYRYSQEDDIVVATDIANRNRAETEGLIGFFINLLVLRTDLSGYPSFFELLKRVREVTLEAYARQDLPFEKLVEELQPERHLSNTSLFQVLFVMQNVPDEELKLPNLTLQPLETTQEKAKFDLALFIEETERGIVGCWKYNADLFEQKAIALLSEHYETLLNSIVAQPDARIDRLEILSESEKKEQTAVEAKQKKKKFEKFKKVKPKAVKLSSSEALIKTDYLQVGQTLPLLITPAVKELDLINWIKSDRQFLEDRLLKNGAILFRDFKINSATDFENLAQAICPNLFGDYGDLPRTGISNKVYSSTPYPPDRAILFHNESSHLHCFPEKIWFFCLNPAQQGGETPIVDCRKVYQLINPKLREKFEQKQLMYVRNYLQDLDVSWQDFFHTNEKTVVENYCRQGEIEFEWLPNNGLRTRKLRPAIARHPQTKEWVFFNQIQLHHSSYLDDKVRESMVSLFGAENFPRNVYYGDGSPIEEAAIAEINDAYQQAKISFPWQQGDVLMLDNLLTAHGRNPYQGARKILVAMGEMIRSEEIRSGVIDDK
jgi:alpha-ketoglutarate-dependent taurine dioxygenase